MTEEELERLKQIREQRAREYGHSFTGTVGTDAMMGDIDFLLSLLDRQAAEGDLKERDDVLAFFGASLKENGDLYINMKKYHAAHLCQEHSFQPWRRSEIEEKCVMCLVRDRDKIASALRRACVERVRFMMEEWGAPDSDLGDEVSGFRIDAGNDIIKALEYLTLDQVEETA